MFEEAKAIIRHSMKDSLYPIANNGWGILYNPITKIWERDFEDKIICPISSYLIGKPGLTMDFYEASIPTLHEIATHLNVTETWICAVIVGIDNDMCLTDILELGLSPETTDGFEFGQTLYKIINESKIREKVDNIGKE